ncbi:nuclear transport factor 2 family protein [Dactylosporangium sp. CS-033363]|uniref:nuclear transport factor 2 family protein n=1 Tax=Dactylosporangium sp. CS-033363 TaxID=3239935 RepID=UPI003D8A1CDB
MTNEHTATVQRAMSGFLETGDVDTLGTFLHPDFVHRRPGGHDASKAEWLDSVRAAQTRLTAMEVEIRHLLPAGDHVVVHTVRRLPGGPAIAVIELWRFADGLIVEGNEIIEPLAQVEANLRWWEPAR